MEISKVFNNNVAVVLENNEEKIVMRREICFAGIRAPGKRLRTSRAGSTRWSGLRICWNFPPVRANRP